MASTSSTPPLPRRQINYDVFLSFRGTDVGKTFVGHLYNKLVETGIRTFKDDGELEKGQRIEELLQIIKESQFAIVVFSQDYASAKWCLEEVATIMECQQQYGEEIIIPIFYDVEPSVVRNQTKSFAESFKRHEENTEKAKVEWWKEALKKAGQISGYHYYHLKNDFNGFEAKCVQPVVDETHQLLLKVFVFNFVRFEAKCVQPVVDEIYARLNQSNLASTVLEKNLVGLDSRVGAIGKLLRMEPNDAKCVQPVVDEIYARLNQSNLASTVLEKNLVGLDSRVGAIGKLLRMEPNDAQFIGIWGMGGIGKTTIAQIVLKRFSSQFDGVCFLANIRENQGEMIELQKTLIETILKGPLDNISNVHDGMEVIMTRFKEKKVLIVLDDVDLVGQLQKLAGDCDWFGGGSRVIITTRDVGILRSHGVDKKYIYKVETLGFEEAIQLFRLHAFKQKVKTGMEQLCQLVVHYCKGLPLALKIVGSSLCGLEVADWERTLEKLKDTPYGDIHGMLKISFDRLDPKNKKIFLHIACFFRHEKEEYVKNVLKSCDLHPVIGMRVLIEKSLISVTEFGRIEMHDIIQDMGWHIARQENPRSRVWELKEVDDVLCGKMELTKHIECISFPYNTYGLWPHNYENISSAFEALKILIGKWPWSFNEEEDNKWPRSFKHGYSHSIKEDDGMDNYQQLPSSLRWLHFPDYPFRSLPTSFHPSSMDTNPSELVGLCLHRSSLQNCWMTKELNKLTYLDLSLSYSLLETPNFAMMPNLRSLDLSHCSKLKEIHPSVERLEKLVLLDVSYCIKLEKLPSFIQVSSLQFLKLEYCLELENFPEIQASMPLVPELNLKSIPIRELPSSIQQLCGLTKLSLSFCEHLEYLPNNLCELKSLKVMKLESCKKLESLPENLGYLSKLEELYIFDTVIFQLPSSVTQLSSLECLCWGHKFGYCESSLKFVHSVSSLRSLKRLQLHNFKNIDEGLPSDLGRCLISLEYLNLQGSNFGYLPKSFSQFPHLQYLDIRDCEKLEKLPKLPKTIRELYVDSHFAFRNKSINIAMLAIKYPMLYSVSFSSRDEYDSFRGETILAKKSIQFPFQRMTPFSVSYSSYSFYGDNNNHYAFLRSFKYRRYKSDRISFNLNPNWYSTQFVGFAVYFVSSQADIRRPRSYQGFDDHTHHYVIKAKLSSYNDIKKEDLETKCVIAGSTYYKCTHNCFVYLPFSSLWPESKPMMEANDYSRFEVDLEASADWGINLLYKSPIGAREHGEEEGAREHIANYHRSDSGLLTTNDIGCLTSLESEIEYLNHGSKNLDSLPAYYSQLHSLRYFDISGCGKLKELPELPTTIRELYANSNLASESNIAKLATKYPKLYSISFSCTDKRVTFSPVELARKFAHAPFQIMRNSSFIVTYPIGYCSTDRDMTKWFKYSSHDSNKISISLKPSWHNQSFVGFVVCFILNSRDDGIWKSCPDGRPFRYGEVIAQLVHKDNEQVLQTNCVIGRQCDEEIDDVFMDSQIICFAYIPFLSLFNNKSRDTPSDYLVFEVGFGEAASNASTDWSCGLLYKNDESLSEAIWSKTTSHDNGDSGLDITKHWQLTEIVLQSQCLTVSMPECFDVKVVRLLYTKSGVGIMTISLYGTYKIWKWSHNRQNPSAKATANSVPQYWQTNSGLCMSNDVLGVNIEEVVPCIALSNDGYFFASAFDRKISLFSTKTFGLQEMTTFMSPSASTFLAHDPCVYENIAIGTEYSIILYNFVKEKVIAKLKGHKNRITGLAFSTNPYMLVSSGADAQLCLWNILGRWKKRKSVRIQLPTGEVHSGDTHVMFHVDQLHLLVTHETQLAIYDASKMERISQWIPHGSLSSPISSATYSNNSLLVYASFNDGNIGVLDAHSLRLRCRIAPSAYLSQAVSNRSRGAYPVAIVAHPQKTNQFAIGLTNGTVQVIEPREFERKWGVSPTMGMTEYSDDDEKTPVFEDSDEEVSMTEDSDEEASIMTEDSDKEDSMTEGSDKESTMIEGSDEETTMIEDSDEETRMIEDNSKEAQRITTIATSQQEIGQNRTKPWQLTEIVNRSQCRMVSMPECFDAKVVRILYTKSGIDILALSSDGIHKLWKRLYHNQNSSRKVSANLVPQHWQTYNGLHVSGVNFKEIVPCIALPNSGSFVALAVGREVSLFDIETFEEKTKFMCQSASTFLAFHPRHNNILAIGMEDSTINIYNVWENEVRVNLKGKEGHRKRITGLAFSTCNLLISSGADAQLCAWSIDTWENRISVPIQLPASEVPSGDTQVMFHADQLHLLVTHETQIGVYDASKMERISQWIPQGCLSAPISSATYSCNSQLVYVSFKDGNIGVLDAHSLRLRCRIASSTYLFRTRLNRREGVYAVVIAAHPQEPNQLAVGLTDGSVKVIEPFEYGEWGTSPPYATKEEEEAKEEAIKWSNEKTYFDKGKALAEEEE